MNEILKIKNCLISVSDKKNIVQLARNLNHFDINIISTGNTYKTLKKNKLKCKKVEDITKFPEILDGRVKTLHPKIFGGILGDTTKKIHLTQMNNWKISKIELVVINLYPFEETVKQEKSLEKCIENIDIGGPAIIRSAAKNFSTTAVVVDINDYDKILQEIKGLGGVTLKTRKLLAVKAFEKILKYDYNIYKWYDKNFSSESNKKFLLMGSISRKLRYGENPHQNAEIYNNADSGTNSFYDQLGGKELSYNNFNDIKAALQLLVEFKKPTSVIIKHSIPCGVSEADDITKAWNRSYLADSLSAFGGVVALNRKVDGVLANKLSKIFLEVVAAISFSDEALKILSRKKNLRIIEIKNLKSFSLTNTRQVSILPDSFLVQDFDRMKIKKGMLKTVSKKIPTKNEFEELLFAYKVVKHVKSNAIVISKNKTTVGIGSGNTSRIDSVKFSMQKASRGNKKTFTLSKNTNNCVLASDAFFPFADSIILAKNFGIKSIIQPGGSINDKQVIEEVDKAKISMVFTNKRSFSH